MNFELYIHGATNGQKVLCSKEEDIDYCKSFYTNTIKNNSFFRAEIRRDNSYYTFTRYNLIGGDGRSGGYFGITLRIDKNFCNSIDRLYSYFAFLYNIYIEGKIIQGNRYLVSDLTEQTQKNIENEFGKILSDLQYSLKPIDNSFSKQKGNILKRNINEVSNHDYVAILKENGSILLSEEFPTKDAIVSSAQKQLSELQQTVEQYKNQDRIKQNEINTLNEKMRELKQQAAENKSLKSFEDNIKRIETPIRDIAIYLKQRRENATGIPKKTIKKLIVPVIIALLLLANVWMYYKVDSRLENLEKIEQQTKNPTTTESSTTEDTSKDNTEARTQETTNEDNIKEENGPSLPLLNYDKNKKNGNNKKEEKKNQGQTK